MDHRATTGAVKASRLASASVGPLYVSPADVTEGEVVSPVRPGQIDLGS